LKSNKNVLIGIDGASYTTLKKISDEGIMPNFSKLRKEGVFKQMMASIPDNSAVSWSSIMTGDNPGKHGIFGFTELIPNTYTMKFPNFSDLKSDPFWLRKPEKSYVIINLPFTYPVKEINGYIISGFVSPDINKSVFPKEYLEVIRKIGYQTDVDSGKAYKSKELFLNEIFTVHKKRVKVYRNLWTDVNWDTFMIVFTESDRLGHFMQDVYEDNIAPYYDRYLEYFKSVDDEIGWIAERLTDSDNLIMMSDHGMELIRSEVFLNTYLVNSGFLVLDDAEKKNFNSIKKGTKAFALEPGRIYLNYKTRYPNGSVEFDERDNIISDLILLFESLTLNGERVIRDIIRREEIYEGESTALAPDLLLVPNKGFSIRGRVGKEKLFESADALTLKGMHRGSDSFLYVKGFGRNIIPEKPHVEDILNIMINLEERKK
jgi:predicted AlkP superfamily phosphohydrolase/phosphomutase